MGVVIGGEVRNVRHLNEEKRRGAVSLLHGGDQLPEVLHAPLRRGVGEPGVTARLQRDALDLHQMQPVGTLQTEVQPGRAEAVFRADGECPGVEGAGELPKDAVGCLGVHVDEAAALLHGDEVVGGLAPRRGAGGQVHPRAGDQQLAAAASIFHVADRLRAVQLHQRDEAVGAREKAAAHHVPVFHGVPSLPRAESGISIAQ